MNKSIIDKSRNPFQTDEDRKEIWDILVYRDIEAFLNQDWNATGVDFLEEEFFGMDGEKNENMDLWNLKYPTLEEYKKVWIQQSIEFAKEKFLTDKRTGLFNATNLTDIEINKHRAVAHKKFDGKLIREDGSEVVLNWQTLYYCKKVGATWKVSGFTGYLPHVKLTERKHVPSAAIQHTTAGPYSPVLEINSSKLVVISGQAPIDYNGKVIGSTIEEQTEFTFENCKKQLAFANVGLNDVFKVNVYLTDLANWERFNKVYGKIMPKPYPVRTTVQTPLLYNFLVEIEMWAVKK